MTLQECYASFGGDYEGLVSRVMGETYAEMFAMKFLKDGSFATLVEAMEKEDYESAFRAAHTLKGVCANLGIAKLQEVASALTEQLRAGGKPTDMSLLDRTKEEYQKAADALKAYQEAKA